MKKIFFASFIFFFIIQGLVMAFPVSLKDDSGTRFTILMEPRRIISAMPSNTEILFDLGLGNKIVGVTEMCNFPPEARNIEKIGSVVLNAEKILSLNPDFVLMLGDAQRSEISRLKTFGLPVFVINPHTLYELMDSIKLIGKATGTEIAANNLVRKMEQDIMRTSTKYKNYLEPKVFVVIWSSPLITAGKGTFIDDLIRLSGGRNIEADSGQQYPLISFEKLLADDPDYIIVSGSSLDEVTRLKKDPKWKMLKAVRENKILLINADIITRPTPRLADALDLIVSFIHKRDENEK